MKQAERRRVLLTGTCPTCGHARHTERCAHPEPLGEHWVHCGCLDDGALG